MTLTFNFQIDYGQGNLDLKGTFDRGITGVFGPSGAGKSSLLHCLAGIRRPDSGSLVMDGQVLFDSSKGVDTPVFRRGFGLVFQEGRLFPHMNVVQNLTYGLRFAKNPDLTLAEVAGVLKLEKLLHAMPTSLSGGEAQRVALGRALLAAPRLLLLDEPLANLDRDLRREVLPYLRDIRDAFRIPMIMVSHHLGDLLQLTDMLYLIKGGQCLGHGTFQALCRDPVAIPFLHDKGMVNVLRARSEGVDDNGICAVTIMGAQSGSSTWFMGTSVPAGSEAHLSLRPEDISLVRQPVDGLSIRNQLEGCILYISETSTYTYCEVEIAGVPLLVEITPFAKRELNLETGQTIWCLFKAQALRLLD